MANLTLLFLLLIGVAGLRSQGSTFHCPLDSRITLNRKLEAERQITSCILNDYSPQIRPVLGPDGKTEVKVVYEKISVKQMLEKEDYMSIEIHITYSWKDHRLQWDPASYEGIPFVYAKVWKLWSPELVLYDGRDDTGTVVNYARALVNHTGQVTWSPQIRVHAFCQGDYGNFPFDTQRCKFSFRDQVYEEEDVLIEVMNGNELYPSTCQSQHNEWSVLDCRSYVENTTIGADKSQSLTLEVGVKRNSQYHQYVIILPSTILCVLVLSLYWVPHHSNQRFALAGGLLFASLMSSLLLQNFLPIGISQIPVVVSYLLYIMVMIIITTIISLFTLNLSSVDPSTHNMPELVKKVLLHDVVLSVTGVAKHEEVLEQPNTSFENTGWKKNQPSEKEKSSSSDGKHDKVIDSLCGQLEILTQVSASSFSSLDNPWIQLSQVVDRLFFYTFFFIFVIVTSALYAH